MEKREGEDFRKQQTKSIVTDFAKSLHGKIVGCTYKEMEWYIDRVYRLSTENRNRGPSRKALS
jgi:hypothetical protein